MRFVSADSRQDGCLWQFSNYWESSDFPFWVIKVSSEEQSEEPQPEQAVQIPDEEEEEPEGGENEEFEDEEVAIESGPQSVVVQHREPAPLPEPVKEIQLKPTSNQTDAWRDVIKVMKALGMEEATFKYNGNLQVRIMDTSRVSMVDAAIDMGLGISSLVTEQPPVTRKFTCDLTRLDRALKMSKPTIDIGQDEVTFQQKGYSNSTKITVPIIDNSDEEIPAPQLADDTRASIDFGELFAEMTKYLGSEGIPNHLAVTVENGKASVKGANDDLQKFEMTDFKADGKDAHAVFSSAMLRALKSKSWDLTFNTDMPLKAKTAITHTDYNNKNGHMASVVITDAQMTVFLAPRIETDE